MWLLNGIVRVTTNSNKLNFWLCTRHIDQYKDVLARKNPVKYSTAEHAAFRFLHVSTDEGYGTLAPQDPPFVETNPLAPNSHYLARQSASAHDVSAPFCGDLKMALAKVKARVLMLPCSQDRLLGLENAKGIKGGMCVEIDSNKGHLAWRPVVGSEETSKITPAINKFLS